jgi:hypothetical protein
MWIEDGLDLARDVVLDVRNTGILGVECLGRVRLASSFASESCSSSYATLHSHFPFCSGTLSRPTHLAAHAQVLRDGRDRE